jgi:WD40 repeat protein
MPSFRLACFLFVAPLLAAADQPTTPRLDSHGFPLPDGAIARLGDLHCAQSEPITAIALSPDGKVVASAGNGIYLWNAEIGRITREIPDSNWIGNLAFSKNGQLLAAVTGEGEISIWNVAKGQEQVLERIASLEACQLLKTLASGDEGAALTREARGALARWRQ